jgi:hypothetical protein
MLAAAALTLAGGVAAPASAEIGKCQKAIAGVHLKLEAAITKSLNKCADGYQKAVAKGDPLSSISGKCNDGLAKTIDLGNATSAMAKAKIKLADLITKGTCDDNDLQGLGHLPVVPFGDRWQRSVLISALDTAYTAALSANGALLGIMVEINDAGGCALCSVVTQPPCHAHSCILDGTSGGTVQTVAAPLSFGLAGAIGIGVCDVPSINLANEFAVLGRPSKGFDTVTVIPGVAFACVTAFRTEGVLNCGGAAPRSNYSICQDHVVDEIGVDQFVDECHTDPPPAGTLCQPDTEDTETPGDISGGPCLTSTAVPAASGDAFFLATTKIQVILAAEVGPDTIPCTDDDTPAAVTAANQLPQTTGSATAQVLDADAVDGQSITAGPVSGSPFNCAEVSTSNTSGGKTVSTLPALNALLGNDLTTASSLSCQ